MLYGLLVWLHVVLAMTTFGLNVAYGWMQMRAPEHAHRLDRLDHEIAAPAFWALGGSGALLAILSDIPIRTPWLAGSIALYALTAVGGWWGFRRVRTPRAFAAWTAAILAALAAIAFLMVTKPGA